MGIATTSPNGMAVGFVPKVRTVRIECDWPDLQPADPDGEKLWAEIEDLTFDEQAAIPYGKSVKYADAWDAIAPYVHAWNATGRNRETRHYEPLPPPSEAGPEVFGRCAKLIVNWLLTELKFGPMPTRALEGKGSSSESGQEPKNGTDSERSAKPNATKSRSRKATA